MDQLALTVKITWRLLIVLFVVALPFQLAAQPMILR